MCNPSTQNQKVLVEDDRDIICQRVLKPTLMLEVFVKSGDDISKCEETVS